MWFPFQKDSLETQVHSHGGRQPRQSIGRPTPTPITTPSPVLPAPFYAEVCADLGHDATWLGRVVWRALMHLRRH
jgi:hypothetical protein